MNNYIKIRRRKRNNKKKVAEQQTIQKYKRRLRARWLFVYLRCFCLLIASSLMMLHCTQCINVKKNCYQSNGADFYKFFIFIIILYCFSIQLWINLH